MKKLLLFNLFFMLFVLFAPNSQARLAPKKFSTVSAKELKTWDNKDRVAYLKTLMQFMVRVEAKQPLKLYVDGSGLDTQFLANLFIDEAWASGDIILGNACLNGLNILTVGYRNGKSGPKACVGGIAPKICNGDSTKIACNSLFSPSEVCVEKAPQGASSKCLNKITDAELEGAAEAIANDPTKGDAFNLFQKDVLRFCGAGGADAAHFSKTDPKDCDYLNTGLNNLDIKVKAHRLARDQAKDLQKQKQDAKEQSVQQLQYDIETSTLCKYDYNGHEYRVYTDGNTVKSGRLEGSSLIEDTDYQIEALPPGGEIYAFNYTGKGDFEGGQWQVRVTDKKNKKCEGVAVPDPKHTPDQLNCSADDKVVCVAKSSEVPDKCDANPEGLIVPRIEGDKYFPPSGGTEKLQSDRFLHLFGKSTDHGNIETAHKDYPYTLVSREKDFFKNKDISFKDASVDLGSAPDTSDFAKKIAQVQGSCAFGKGTFKKIEGAPITKWFDGGTREGELYACVKLKKNGKFDSVIDQVPNPNYVAVYKDAAGNAEFIESGRTNADFNPLEKDVWGRGSKNPYIHLDISNQSTNKDGSPKPYLIYTGTILSCAKNAIPEVQPIEKPYNFIRETGKNTYTVCSSDTNQSDSYKPSGETISVANGGGFYSSGTQHHVVLNEATVEGLKKHGKGKCNIPELLGDDHNLKMDDFTLNAATYEDKRLKGIQQ